MSERCSYTGDRAFSANTTIAWNEQVAVESSLDFSQVSDATLTDSINDTYVTAVEDSDTTQYLSVLETTNNVPVEDLHNMTLENSKMDNVEVLEGGDANEQQVIVFSVDGSDELYGIQFAPDEEGNVQKYQFQFRTTEDGQLEAIPESVQLLANDLQNGQDIESGESEVTETAVVYQEDSNVQECADYAEHVNKTKDQQYSIQFYIKGEPEVEGQEEEEEDMVRSAGRYTVMAPSADEEVVEEYEEQYDENEMQIQSPNSLAEENSVDIKPGIVKDSLVPGNIKEEIFQEDSQDVTDTEIADAQGYNVYNHRDVEVKQLTYQGDDGSEEQMAVSGQEIENNVEGAMAVDTVYEEVHEAVVEYEQYSTEEEQHDEVESTDDQSVHEGQETHFDQVFIKENMVGNLHQSKEGPDDEMIYGDEQEICYAETCMESNSDNEDYQIVEGLHVTAEGNLDEELSYSTYHEPDNILQEVEKKYPSVSERVNILKQPSLLKACKASKEKNNKALLYYVVPHVEKENVNSLSVNFTGAPPRPIRTNPRSILKSSFPETRERIEVKSSVDERFNKRFARSKEAVQARLFNNFISKTTIPHAPVRQTRLPRKQQIKPVDNRRDEEIIVQEVMVGSNGFIEDMAERLRNTDKLQVTHYVVLTDSDDDTKECIRKKKRKKHKKGDMEYATDSDASVIEIPSGDEEKCDMQENPKRGRGRPPKKTTEVVPEPESMTDSPRKKRGRPQKSIEPDESLQKKGKTNPDETEVVDITKEEFMCPNCPKTFPSQNSLSTHIQHHNLENSLRSSQTSRANVAKTAAAPVEYRHKCELCQETFKNSILLRRHACSKQTQRSQNKRLECNICKKSFPDAVAMSIHKRSHIKENLIGSTAIVKVSPKKIKARPTSTLKSRSSPRKVTTSGSTAFKCKDCSRVCFTQESLDLHEKTHRKFTCGSCATSFPSRLLLDAHVRVNCVKPTTASRTYMGRPSYKIRKSYVQSPRRRSERFIKKNLLAVPSANSNLNTTNVGKVKDSLKLNLECDECEEKFTMFQDYFKHQVKEHGLQTPDKSVLMEQKKRLHKPKSLHGGIPTSEGVRKIFADIKSKIALITPKKDDN